MYVVLIAVVAAFSGFLFGFDSSVIADVHDQVVIQLHLSQWQWSQVVSISLIGCVIGIPISGLFADRFSRKMILKIVALGFILGTSCCALAQGIQLLFVGRFIIGICIGIASYIAPLFIAEIAPLEQRGSLVLINGLTITFGQAAAYLMGYFIHDLAIESWRYLFWIGCIPACVLFIGMFFVPHSPRWLMLQYGEDKVLGVLKSIRPTNYNIDAEIAEIRSVIQKKNSIHTIIQLWKKPVNSVLVVGIMLGIFQQFSGINAIMYYGPILFQSAGFYSIQEALFATFIIGAINFLFTICTLYYVDKLGRRPLLITGTLLAATSLFSIAVLFNRDFAAHSYTILLLFMFYVMGYCISVGSLFWVIISEIYPINIRGMAMSIATVLQWAANFIVSISFLSIYESQGSFNTFALFGMLCFIAFVYIYFYVPETTGISLEEIEANVLSGKRVRDIGQKITPIFKKKVSHLMMDKS